MKPKLFLFYTLICLLYFTCSKNLGGFRISDGLSLSLGGGGDEIGTGDTTKQNPAGIITAAEWNDLLNWPFWESIMNRDTLKEIPNVWHIYNTNRISVLVTDALRKPQVNISVDLFSNTTGNIIFSTKTDNSGKAELWPSLFNNSQIILKNYSLNINKGEKSISNITFFANGVNEVIINSANKTNEVDIAFVVDATGSMSDEIDFLKNELYDVLQRIQDTLKDNKLMTSAVFYRDEGDDYLTRENPFSNNITSTINFIKNQSANGGGDFPEAVHSALDVSINNLQWNIQAKNKIIFLLLDAPPHNNETVKNSLQKSISLASSKGIKIIPISASGIDDATELFLRMLAISTNSTYIFITDDSGVGNPHKTPIVGKYTVEKLNNLLVRLVAKYSL